MQIQNGFYHGFFWSIGYGVVMVEVNGKVIHAVDGFTESDAIRAIEHVEKSLLGLVEGVYDQDYPQAGAACATGLA